MDAYTPDVIPQEEFLSYRRRVFPHITSDTEYRWDFLRPFAGNAPDVFVLRDKTNTIAAGSAVTYREIKNSQGESRKIGIMTGSWTLPEFRNQGWFTKIIQHSAHLSKQRNCAALTAFVTADNASARRLIAANSTPFHSRYIFSKPTTQNFQTPEIVSTTPELIHEIYTLHNQETKETKTTFFFGYSEKEFAEQFFERPTETLVFRFGENFVLVEESNDAIKILYTLTQTPEQKLLLLQNISAWAFATKQKKIYYFTTSQSEIKQFEKQNNFISAPGFLTYLPLPSSTLPSPEILQIHLGDKM